MSKKEKKPKKEKSGSSFFSNLNADSTIEYGFAEKNPKSKWSKWIISGLVLGVTATGVIVPWTMSSCTLSLSKPYGKNDGVYVYIDPITGQEVSVTWEEFEKRINSMKPSSSIFDKWDEVFYNSTLEEMYNQEREAFLKFKAIYTKLHNAEPVVANFGSDLSVSYQDIEKEQKEILETNKKNFQKSINTNSWIDSWISELQTNSIYGPQTGSGMSVTQLETKALEFMITSKIKSSALARYTGVSINSTSWTFKDLSFARQDPTIGGDIEYTTYENNEGEKTKITKSEAIKIWRSYLTDIKDNAGSIDTSVAANVIVYNNDDSKVAVFESKSYIPSYRNPITNDELLNVLNKNWNFALISSFKIPITPGETNISPFTISTETIQNLFKVQNIASTTTGNFVAMSQISHFKGANEINTSLTDISPSKLANIKDQMLINTFASTSSSEDSSTTRDSSSSEDSSTTSKNLGSSKLTTTINLLKSTQSSDSSSSSSESTTIDMFNVAALMSSDTGATSSTSLSDSIYSINQSNPFEIFMKLLFTIATSSSNTIDFSSYSYVEKNWNALNYGSKIASSEVTAFVKLLKENLNNTTFEFNSTKTPQQYNEILTTYTSALKENDLLFLGRILNCIMIGDTTNINLNYSSQVNSNKFGYWTLYKLSDTTYAHISTSEMTIFSKGFSTPTLADVRKMVVSDLIQTTSNTTTSESEGSTSSDSDSSTTTTSTLYYDVVNMFNNLNNDNLIIQIILSNVDNQQKFKDGIKEYYKEEDEATSQAQVDEIYENFVKIVNIQFDSSINSEISSLLSSISSSLTTLIDLNRFYDFGTMKDANGEEIVIFQTQTKYGNNSISKTKEEIDKLFINNIEYILTSKNSSLVKGGK